MRSRTACRRELMAIRQPIAAAVAVFRAHAALAAPNRGPLGPYQRPSVPARPCRHSWTGHKQACRQNVYTCSSSDGHTANVSSRRLLSTQTSPSRSQPTLSIMSYLSSYMDPSPPPDQSLLEACEHGNLTEVETLLSAQTEPPPGCKALLGAAASNRHPNVIRYILSKYNNQQLRLDGDDALKATFGGLECFRQVYQRDPSLLHNHVEHFGNPMQQAISRSDVDLLNFTLQHGADPGRVISDTTSLWRLIFLPIETAVLCSTPEVARILLRHGATLNDTSALDIAATVKKWNALEMVVCLVEEGADINATSREQKFEHGRTAWGPPLQSAIRAQHVPIVRYLLERGASPGVKDSQGRTAWDQASEVGNEDILRLLATMPGATSA